MAFLDVRSSPTRVRLMERKGYDHEILLLQGGGALGAYQAGVYEGLVEAGVAPTWVVGISIGAINASLIVGNPPERRVERLREFWRAHLSKCRAYLAGMARLISTGGQHMAAMSAATFGIRAFFTPQCRRLRLPRMAPKAPSACTIQLRSRPLWKSWLISI